MSVISWGDLRPEVQQFALAMELELRANDHKPGWQNEAAIDLCDRIEEELQELVEAIEGNEEGGAEAHLVLEEAVDVANMAMMVWDVVRNNAAPF